jgi:transposase
MDRKVGRQNPAVRLCVRCKQLRSTAGFPPRRRVCTTCQPAQEPRRRRRGNTQREVEATRARGRAPRRLALEYPADYWAACPRRLEASPAGLPAKQAWRRAVANGKSDLADQYRERFAELYRQELRRARSEQGPIRQGRPPGARDQLAIRSASFARTWQPPARPVDASVEPPDEASTGATGPTPREAAATLFEQGRSPSSVVERPGIDINTAVDWQAHWRRKRAVALFEEGHSPSSVAQQLGIARQTAARWGIRWRTGGAAALEYRRGRGPAIPDRQLPLIEQALLQGPAAHGFDGEVWSAPQVAEVIERLTGVRLTPSPVKRLLRHRLGWTAQRAQVPAALRRGDDRPLNS